MSVPSLLLVILFSPLVAAGLIWAFGRRAHNLAAGLSVLAAGIICAGTLYLLYGGAWDGQPLQNLSLTWLQLGDFEVRMGFYLNEISALMLFVVGFVGFWIHVFSLGYMKGDPGKGRFFGGLSIFMFSMLGIVLADNLLMMFVFWELVGFSSYMLIGHYLKTPEARDASKKAFIVNRVGDFGFLLGIILTYWAFGTTNLAALQEAAAHSHANLTLITLLLFCGVLGKSAQMPLHVWLPDAMAGPTPISALIHAATMVAAGVFLLARIPYLFTETALDVVTWVGVITAVCAALWAFAQSDIKKILAYSTLSQLGYMVAAFGFGTTLGLHAMAGGETHGEAAAVSPLLWGAGAALFHLMTHAFFKALLFLGSGSVIHACHHEQDIFQMGGLAKKMPITALTFLIGVVAIAGIPYIGAGFFSKDVILYLAKDVNPVAFGLLTFTALLTATYMGRLFVIAFLGKPKSDHAAHAHESPVTMWLPLVVLAAFSVLGGYAFVYPEVLQHFLHAYVPHPHGADANLMLIISAVASVLGLAFALLYYRPGATEDRLERQARPLWAASRSRFYFDEIYGWYVRSVQERVAELVALLDTLLVGGLLVRGTAGVAALFGVVGRSLHTGSLGSYVWWFFAGVCLYWAYSLELFASWF